MLDHVMDGDHAGVVQPGRRPRFPHRAGNQVGMLVQRLRRQQDLLDRHHAVQQLIVTAPHPAHAALAHGLGQQVPPANQNPLTRHGRIIGESPTSGTAANPEPASAEKRDLQFHLKNNTEARIRICRHTER